MRNTNNELKLEKLNLKSGFMRGLYLDSGMDRGPCKNNQKLPIFFVNIKFIVKRFHTDLP